MIVSKESSGGNSNTRPAYVRDKDYYFEDGSIVVLAEDRLFKIHRTLFERNSPFFQSLMSLPQDSEQESPEGKSDENPIVCPDPAADFRALCWVVYSSPTDILAQQAGSPTIDVPKLIRVAAISHKYDFAAYGEWAWNALDDFYTAQPILFFHKCGIWFPINRVFKLAVECGKASFVDRLEQVWLRQISSPATRTTAFKEASNAVEGSDLFREFHAKCYYTYLQSIGGFAQSENAIPLELDQVGSYIDDSLADLSSERRMRLLTGFWSLSRLRVRLSQPPKLADNPLCRRHSKDCVNGWESWWKDVMNDRMGLGDPGKLIEHISEKAKKFIGARGQCPIPCQSAVKSTLEAVKRDFDTSLARRFMLS